MTVIEIKDRAHYQDLINNNKVVIIDAWAPWCGPCRFISPIFEQLSEREEFNKSGVVFAKVDVDQAEDVSQELAIQAMPTFISFYDGELQDKLQGADPSGLEKLVQEVTKYLQTIHIYSLKMTVTPIKNLSEFRETLEKNNVVIVDFWAPWCGPCRFISPVLEKMSESAPGIYFAKVDVDEAEDVSQEYGIRAMPTFIAFKDGVKVDEVVGADPSKLEPVQNDKYNKPGVSLAKVDIDAVYEVVKELSVRSVPTFYAFNNGTLESALMGADPGGLEQLVKEATSKVESNGRMTLNHLRAMIFEDRVQELFWY
ncbi:hypothetical protein LB507_006743 [Fusarium sp. FIESC RH6]|nr:hypothetical protein LB507_006743 [Fusarium sp. FIESC RH6]